MKILHIVECFAAGTVHFVNLATQYIVGHEHIILHGERKDEISAADVKAKFPDHVTFINWQSAQREINLIKDYKSLKELRQHLHAIKPDVVHLHSSKAGFIGRVACFISGFKNVFYTPHGAAFLRKDISPQKVKIYSALEKFASILTGTVICCSKSEAENFKKLNIDAEYINNGVHIPEQTYTQKPQENVSVNIITCGRITEQKNPVLFNTIAQAFINNPKVQFTWIGDGELRHSLTSPNIHVTGWMNQDQVKNILETGELYLSTALWEGLPFSVLEAMVYGKCLLLSDCVGNVDLVTEGVNGYTFKDSAEAIDKIGEFLNNPDQFVSMGEKSREICELDFNIGNTFSDYLVAYQRAI